MNASSARARRAARAVEDLLARGGVPSATRAVGVVLLAAPVYGLAMGSASVDTLARIPFMLIAAIKTPMLLLVTTAVCTPAYCTLLLVVGLRQDARAALRALCEAQAVAAVTLAAFSPLVLVAYSALNDHNARILANVALFALAAVCAQKAARERFAPLLAQSRRHAVLLALWLIAYAFVGVQLGWTLRPFLGSPGTEPRFFREAAFTNAYVELWQIAGRAFTE
jgi:hypothetical protein